MNKQSSIGKPMIKVFNFLIILLFFCTQVNAEKPDQQWDRAFNKGKFVLPGTDEIRQVGKAYQDELQGRAEEELWNAIAMQRIEQKDTVYLRENPDNQKGRGVFAIKHGVHLKPWLLQAPHAKFDRYTGRLVEKIFSEGEYQAAMWNSVPRKTQVENSVLDRTADMAHLSGTYWQAVTEGFARIHADGKIIQFHGFDQSKRKSEAGRTSDMIISAGHQYPPIWIQKLAQCLKKTLSLNVSLYPRDVRELGATTNIQGQLLKSRGFNGFLHIEMSKPLRQQLLQSRKLRQLLVNCIR